MTDYGRYNATVKTVQEAATQANGGYHFSASDIRALRYAMRDLQGILDKHDDPREAALKLSSGGYAPAVLLKDGSGYVAFVYNPQAGEFTEQGAQERASDAIDNKGYLSDDWTNNTNAPAPVDSYEREGFSL